MGETTAASKNQKLEPTCYCEEVLLILILLTMIGCLFLIAIAGIIRWQLLGRNSDTIKVDQKTLKKFQEERQNLLPDLNETYTKIYVLTLEINIHKARILEHQSKVQQLVFHRNTLENNIKNKKETLENAPEVVL